MSDSNPNTSSNSNTSTTANAPHQSNTLPSIGDFSRALEMLREQRTAPRTMLLTPSEFMARHTVACPDAPLLDECPICLEYFANEEAVQIVGVEGCTHRIGRKCLEQMLQTRPHEEKKCPFCRTVWIGISIPEWPNIMHPTHPAPDMLQVSYNGRRGLVSVYSMADAPESRRRHAGSPLLGGIFSHGLETHLNDPLDDPSELLTEAATNARQPLTEAPANRLPPPLNMSTVLAQEIEATELYNNLVHDFEGIRRRAGNTQRPSFMRGHQRQNHSSGIPVVDGETANVAGRRQSDVISPLDRILRRPTHNPSSGSFLGRTQNEFDRWMLERGPPSHAGTTAGSLLVDNNQRSEALDRRETALNAREIALNDRELALNRRQMIFDERVAHFESRTRSGARRHDGNLVQRIREGSALHHARMQQGRTQQREDWERRMRNDGD